MSGEPLDVPETEEQRALAQRIDDGVRAGAARLPFPPPKESTTRTYDPKDVKITFKGIEIKGFADGTFVEVARDEAGSYTPPRMHVVREGKVTVTLIGHDPGYDLFHVLEHQHLSQQSELFKRWLKLEKRRAHRARMRARKRRRGW